MTPTSCRLCASTATPFTPWAWHCSGCGVRFSSLEPHIDDGGAVAPDEQKRIAGLRAVRDSGHAIVLDALAAQRPLAGLTALDVGSAHGWFLEAAAARGLRATGIEPARDVAGRARARGLDVTTGYFPDQLADDARFDLMSFNDVLEHLPDPVAALGAAQRHLSPGGHLLICIPTAEGLAYRVATGMARVGMTGPLDRLWQRGLPSPHLWYFTERSLGGVVTKLGFVRVDGGRLPSVERRGLRERIAADPRSGLTPRASYYAIAALTPLLNHDRFSDAMWLLFQKPADV